MSFPKLLMLVAALLFGVVAVVAICKKKEDVIAPSSIAEVRQIEDSFVLAEVKSSKLSAIPEVKYPPVLLEEPVVYPATPEGEEPPEADRLEELFQTDGVKLPIVETVIYKSRVPWQKGRPAWLSNYASHYATSRHFIARSLNGTTDYLKQDVSEGVKFNVYRLDKNFDFHLVIDLSRCKMWLYYRDLDLDEYTLLKTFSVGLGRVDSRKESGLLTPLGTYKLGDKVAIYNPGSTGDYQGQKVEMIRIFGSRWIPFGQHLEGTIPVKGLGIHGNPWVLNEQQQLVEDTTGIGKYRSDGCVRLTTRDIEALFAVVITKPTTIYLVKNFYDAKLPH